MGLIYMATRYAYLREYLPPPGDLQTDVRGEEIKVGHRRHAVQPTSSTIISTTFNVKFDLQSDVFFHRNFMRYSMYLSDILNYTINE